MFFFPNGESKDEYRNSLGKRIEEVVEKYDTKTAAAKAAGVSVEQLNKWIKGDVKVPVEALITLSLGADADFNWVVTGEPSMVSIHSQATGPDRGVDWVINGPEGVVEVQAKRYQPRQSTAEVDIDRLERAILIVERGIEDLDSRPTNAEKAELIAAAYQMYRAPTAKTEQLILRMVKGS